MKANWELKNGGKDIRIYDSTYEYTAPVRELTAQSFKFSRMEADMVLEFDLVPDDK